MTAQECFASEWTTWPEAVAWITFEDRTAIEEVRTILGEQGRSKDRNCVALIGMINHANELRDEGALLPHMSEVERVLIANLERGCIRAEGRKESAALPEAVPPNAWRGGKVLPNETFDLVHGGLRAVWFHDIHLNVHDILSIFPGEESEDSGSAATESPANASEKYQEIADKLDERKIPIRSVKVADVEELWNPEYGIRPPASTIRAYMKGGSAGRPKSSLR
jgi:hypothetical protein